MFRFGRWHVAFGVDDSFGERDLAQWARDLHGHVTKDGFLVLRTTPPLRLVKQDSPGAVWLELGSAPDLPYVQLAPVRGCASEQAQSRVPHYEPGEVLFCRNSINVQAYGDKDFVTTVGAHLQVRDVHLAQTRTARQARRG